MTPQEEKEQAAEFRVWGFSERARRNALSTAFFLVVSWAVYINNRAEKREEKLRAEIVMLQKMMLDNRERAAQEVDAIRKEHSEFLLKLLEEQKKNLENIQRIKRKITKK